MSGSLPTVFRRADLVAAGLDDRGLRRARRRGELVTVAPGCFVEASAWGSLDLDERYELRVRTRLGRLSPRLVASHDSAAALWGMPTLDGWPSEIHVIDRNLDRPTRKSGLVRHAVPLDHDDVTVGRSVQATTALRTVLDLALRDGFVAALMLFDHGLRQRLFTEDEAAAALIARDGARRIGAVSRGLDFASPLSESPGESISRAQMILLGFEPPQLQKQFFEGGREVARVDFWWEGVGVAGEFDGDVKYKNDEMRGGRTIEQVMIDEKWRSESLLDRPEIRRVVRWNYTLARHPAGLAERLARAGVPRRPRRRASTLTFPAQPALPDGQNVPER